MSTNLRVFGYLRRNWRAALLAYLFLAGTTAFSILTPLVIKQVIDYAVGHHSRPFLFVAALLVLFVVTVAVVLNINWQLGLIFLAALPLAGVRAFTTSRQLRPLWLRVQQAQGTFTSVLQENIVGARVVRAFRLERSELDKFNRSN